jgi:cytoplasmic iron level regulating protein YaaA (DUF328/UPF0246 family)
MIIVLSPAKSLNYEVEDRNVRNTRPKFVEEASNLVDVLKKYKQNELEKLMNISPSLAELNRDRFQNWKPEFKKPHARPSVLVFDGDVYTGLNAGQFTDDELSYAQDHLRILSGMYGVLRPMDNIRPHRLEMGTKLRVNGYRNLYEFWDGKITEEINKAIKETKSKYLINLASNEYFKSIKSKNLKAPVVTPVFKENKGGQFKVVSFFAKKARGLMSAFIIKNQIKDPEELKAFDEEGYIFNEQLSNKKTLTFTRG